MKRKIAAIIACIMALSLLLCGCGAKSYDNAKSESVSYAPVPTDASDDGYYAYDTPSEEAYDSAAEPEYMAKEESLTSGGVSAPAELSEKMIYTAWAEIQTTDFDGSVAKLEAMVAANGGFIQSSSVSGMSYYNDYYNNNACRNAGYTIRVPAQRFTGMKNQLEQLGYLTYINSDAQNITAHYTDVESRLKAYRTEEERLLDILKKAETVEDVITVETRLSEVRYEIESLTSNLRDMDNQVDYSTINISLYEVEEIKPVESVKTPYSTRIKNAFHNSVRDGWETLKDAGVFVVGAVPIIVVLLIFAAIIILIICLIVRAIRRRAAKKREKRQRKQAAKAAKAAAKAGIAPPKPEAESENGADEEQK